jgi:hypothetical protein
MAKAALNKRILFTSKLYLSSKKKLVKYYIRNNSLYGAETWTLWKVDQKQLANFQNKMLKKNGEDQLDRSCEN